ncbi:MAG TPA: DNA polymerase III subunit epsilon [Beijerinckiaceae bacterium]|jgi:DNA polymerase-3 subunit epsilon|nr:DNA polymerase III subunit epsilon [Beijerinckiaceae bacterium]
MREVVLDTETTGTDVGAGDRIVEIGAVELINHIPTGRSFHAYVNPQRSMPQGAFAVHGLSDAFLADKPRFAAVAGEFEEFIEDSRLVIHNAAFDIAFLNAELGRIGRPALGMGRVLDTLSMARRKHPGAPASLDALCARYGIDNSRRTKHGALLDAEILAEVYIELIGGKQADLGLAIVRPETMPGAQAIEFRRRETRIIVTRLSEAERNAHAAFVATLGPNAVWNSYLGSTEAAAS